MIVAYWIVAGLLALFFLYSGGVKVVRRVDKLRPMMGWVDAVPLAALRAIGMLEVLAAIGLILPPLTNIVPALALAAAVGLAVLQLAAIGVHLRRGEATLIGLNLVLLALSAVTIWLATVWL